MSRTRLQLVNQAAKRLGIWATGQTLSADDYNEIDDLWTSLAEDLTSRQVYVVQDVDEVDEAAWLWLADLLAVKAAPSFGLTAQNLAAKDVSEDKAEDRLRIIAAQSPTKRVLTIERFWGR